MLFDSFYIAYHKQKGFVSIILIVVIVAGAVVAGYFYFNKGLPSVFPPKSETVATPIPTIPDEKTEDREVGERVECTTPRPEVCTLECTANPPYLCGSDGKSYCSSCQACSNAQVEWHVTQQNPCGE